MRTQKTILNLVYALGSSLLLMLLGFATRRLLVFNFGNDITAASQVVDKLFNFFSIAEFGVGSVISYRLYEQIAAKDTEKISKYMSMYKWAYRAVGVVICVLAGIGALALPWIMPGVASIQTAYTVYLLNTISTLSGYFLVTRRLMYTCTQQGYLCTRIDFCFNVANYLARIAIALWLPNYILYFGVSILFNTGANLVVAARYKKDFPELHEVKVTLRDFKDLGIFHDLKYYLVHRLSNTIYGSSDTIVTSRMAGSAMATIPPCRTAPPTSAIKSWTALPQPSAISCTINPPRPTPMINRCSGGWICSAIFSAALWQRHISACSSRLSACGWAVTACCRWALLLCSA